MKWSGKDVNPRLASRKRLSGSTKLLLLTSVTSAFILVSLHCPGNANWNHTRSAPLAGRAAETVFLSIPSEPKAINTSRVYSAKPHLAGSAQDLLTAKDFLHFLQRELGISRHIKEPIYEAGSQESQNATHFISEAATPYAWIDTYYPILDTPLDRHVQVIDEEGNVELELNLSEKPDDDTDPDAFEFADAVPTFHGLSCAGDVSGPVVDGGHCTKKEFDEFVEKGVSFDGTIVLCRYGFSFRGLKVKAAQELNASGVLIFNDVNDDGTVTEANGYAPYPHGPARNPNSVQRGGVQFVSMYPGDPTTPGYPSYENVTRADAENVPSVPSLPLSWANAKQLLRLLDPRDSLYRKHIRLVNNVDKKATPIWNTLAAIPGHIKDEVVVLGNHRDAWVLGASDPVSGTATMQEVVRGLGHLLRKGWKPLRTIVIASWDAEEYGLIGSTEWGEDFTEWIDKHVVAYLNLGNGSPLLSHLIRKAAEDLPHPTDKNRSLWDATKDDGQLFGVNGSLSTQFLASREVELNALDGIGVSPLGSGSDYTVFLQRIGIPSTNGGFGATYHDPVYHYHSVFDTERWQEVYGDPGFHRHVAIAKHLGLQALRISGSVILPFNTTHYTLELGKYLDRAEKLALEASVDVSFTELRASIRALHNASLKLDLQKEEVKGDLAGISERCLGRKSGIGSKIQELLVNLSRFMTYQGMLRAPEETLSQQAGDEVDAGLLEIFARSTPGSPTTSDANQVALGVPECSPQALQTYFKRAQVINKKLIAFERGFISKDGIKDRKWFKHLGVAPGKWLGYGATTLPGIVEAITFDGDAALAQDEADRLRYLLDLLSEAISG